MRYFQLIVRFILFFTSVASPYFIMLFGQNRYTVSLNGTYDFDTDGLSEFLSLEKAAPQDKQATVLAYYEIDDVGKHVELWRYTVPAEIHGSFVDARVADTNGDGLPEIIALLNVISAADNEENPHMLIVFNWHNGSFARTASTQWTTTARPSNIAIIDIQNDSIDEIAVPLGSPLREIKILAIDYTGETPRFATIATLTSEEIGSGYGHIYVAAVDHDQDGFTDLMAFSPELKAIQVHIFENQGGTFVQGSFYRLPLDGGLASLIASSINRVDIDQDGIDDVLVPFRNGTLLALSAIPNTVTSTSLDKDLFPLFAHPTQGVNDTAINEILLTRAEMGITGRKIRSLELEAVGMKEEPTEKPVEPPSLPAVKQVELTRTSQRGEEKTTPVSESQEALSPPGPERKVQRLQLTAIERKPVEEMPEGTVQTVAPEEAATEITEKQPQGEAVVPATPPRIGEPATVTPAEPEEAVEEPGGITTPPARTSKRVQKIELTAVEKGGPTSATLEPESLPPNVEIADTVTLGDTLTIPMETDETKAFHSFKWLAKEPWGATFVTTSRSIQWTPLPNQLGVHKLSFQVQYKTGEKFLDIETIERGGAAEHQVVPTIESDTVRIYVLVQDSVKAPTQEKID